MKTLKTIFSTVVLLAISSSANYGQELDKHLKLLEPLTNKLWEAKFEFPRIGTVTQQFEWEIIWGGKAIKYKSNLEKVNFHSESFFYWDHDKQQIGMFSISNRNNFTHGYVKEENGKILMYGFTTFPDKKIEFKNYFEFTEDGNLLDKFFRFEDGEWKAGHSRELYEIKE